MVVNSVFDHFERLGFSEYEAKAYIALLSIHPATAYEAARESGIPTSKIYEVLDRLVLRQVVSVVETDGKKRYTPQPANEFVEVTRKKLESTLDGLKSDLSRIGTDRDISYIWNLSDYSALMDKAQRMVDDARSHVLVSAWSHESVRLESRLNACGNRGVKTALVHFGPEPPRVPMPFVHPIEDTIYEEKGGRGLVVVADGKEALMGTIHENDVVEGAWSLNRGFVTLAEDYVKHDIYIMKIVSRMDAELQTRFGKNYTLLRDVFSDREVES